MASPWLIFSYITSGTFMQTSGIAIAFKQHASFLAAHSLFSMALVIKILTQIVSMIYILFSFSGSHSLFAFFLGLIASIHFKKRDYKRKYALYAAPLFIILPFFLKIEADSKYALIIALIAALASFMIGCILGASSDYNRDEYRQKINAIAPLLFFVGAILCYYAVYSWSFQIWYYPSSFFILTLFIGAGFSIFEKISDITDKQFCCILFALFMLFLTQFAINYSEGGIFPQNLESKDIALWLKDNIPVGKTIGSFNSGIYGYYSGHTVVNLDGVINNNAYYALRSKNIWEYIQDRTDYLVESEKVLEEFSIFADKNYLSNTEIVYTRLTKYSNRSPIKVYKVED